MQPFHPAFIIEALIQILPYLWKTLLVMFSTIIIGGILGLLIAFLEIKAHRPVQIVIKIYIYLVRCVPAIIMLFVVYYGLPMFLNNMGVQIRNDTPWVYVIATFSIMHSVQISQVFRSAYQAIDVGQMEAAVSHGMSSFQGFRRIVLPQAFLVALPNIKNALVTLLKEGALAYSIGFVDIMGMAQRMVSVRNGAYFMETYIAVGAIYFILVCVIENCMNRLESFFSRGKRLDRGRLT